MLVELRCRKCGEEYAADLPSEEMRCPACGGSEADYVHCSWQDFSCG